MRPVLLLLLLMMGLGSAQESTQKASATFYCFQYANGLKDIYVPTGEDRFQKLELSTANMLGPVSVLVRDGVLTLHDFVETEEGEPSYPRIGTAKVKDIKRPLVVLLPGSEESTSRYGSLIIDRSETQFPQGSIQFINLTQHRIRALIGETRLASTPGSVRNIKPTAPAGEMMIVLFEYEVDSRWRSMTKTRWASRPDRRSILCAYIDPRDNRAKMRSIPEREIPVSQ